MDLPKILEKVKEASRKLASVHESLINAVLMRLAELLEKKMDLILKENAKDLKVINKNNLLYDRVELTEKRIKAMAESVREIANYESPIGLQLEHKILENGLYLRKVSVPLGVVGAIFEARPNVVIDIFSLCFKARNACVLKGGSQAKNSNKILARLILEAIGQKLDNVVLLLKNDRTVLSEFLKMSEYVDVIVPRGGHGLIKFVRQNSLIPVIETGAGVVHTYFDQLGDIEKGRKIIFNAKVSRPSVCNALDTLIIHKSRLKDLVKLCEKLAEKKVQIYADSLAFKAFIDCYSRKLLFAAKEENFGKEYLSLKMAVKTVKSLQEAVEHINKYGSKHSEAIITENKAVAEKFLQEVDSACVYVNASTRFTDGWEFGLGAEVGISTQKLHARGPMGIKELTTYKWIIKGDGQVRE